MGPITKIRIFPSIGIMRVGNSPDEYFVGPEIPGQYVLPEGGFKDAQCRIKRQAARFRLYGYDDQGSKPVEITAKDADITWTVQLGNKKASGPCIHQTNDLGETERRNAWYKGKPEDLDMIADAQSLSGKNMGPVKFEGRFLKKENGEYKKSETVLLGEMLTDEIGRLLVLGGFGKAGGVVPADVPDKIPEKEAYPFFKKTYNTPGWYDDIADGPITASVSFNGLLFPQENILPAWVICGPPAFVPQMLHLTTLYDALRQTALNKFSGEIVEALMPPLVPSFKKDVLPILQRTLDLFWVTNFVKISKPNAPEGTYKSHDEARHFNSFKNAAMDKEERALLFGRLIPPGNSPPKGDMPKFWGDNYMEATETILTPTQYTIMENWANENWADSQASPEPLPFENPEDLTRAALESCLGGGLHPGIEAGQFLRDKCGYIEPFRLDHGFEPEVNKKLEAGDITRDMSCPWQSDFKMCEYDGAKAWWPAHRPDDVFPEIDSVKNGTPLLWTRDIVNAAKNPGRTEMVENWHRLGFVVRQGEVFIETERHLVCNDLFLILDRTHFSANEVPNTFENCFYVVIEGFSPSELGIKTAILSSVDLEKVAPKTPLTNPNTGSPTSKMIASPQTVLFEVTPFDENQHQRITFVYKIQFDDASDFSSLGNQTITLTATKKHPTLEHTFSAIGQLTLFLQPNPYMQDGPVTWLSEDVRVFKVFDGQKQTPVGKEFPKLIDDSDEAAADEAAAKAANEFITSVVTVFNTDPVKLEGHAFEALETEQENSELALAKKIGKTRVFNFAVARVRYRGNVPAEKVRVYFRLFTTAATGLEYNEATTYRRRKGENPVALLGLQGGSIASIPCYGDARAETEAQQTDELNVKTLVGDDKGERYYYFGCWLDFNQTTPHLPDPFNPLQKKSIQEQIRGLHQCLVAEIQIYNDPIDEGVTPASSDNLAQRNLMINQAENPGSQASRIVHHTFEIKAAGIKTARPDELMIRWNDLPRSAKVTLYMPGVDSEVMRLAERNYEARRLERADAHTIRCLPGDVTYVPLPTGRIENIPALLSIELPEGIQRGQKFNVVVHQIAGKPRRMLGAFQLNIPVGTKAELLEPEIRSLSVLRHIALSIPSGDRWYPVFLRYLDQIAGRVRGFGGDPNTVVASPDGNGVNKAASLCSILGWFVSLSLALFIIVAGLHPLANNLPEVIATVVFVAALMWWAIKCGPSVWRAINVGLVGLGIGGAILAILWLAGFAQQHGLIVLTFTILSLGALIIWGVLSGCFTFVDKHDS